MHMWKLITGSFVGLMILAGFIGECTDSTVIENSKSDQYIYEVHNNYVEIKEYIGNEVSITIPETIGGKVVCAIQEGAFANNNTIESVKIPESITTIKENAFLYCSNLESVFIPRQVQKIGNCAFEGTKWLEKQTEEFVIVGDGIFIKYNGEGGDITIPEGVKMINEVFAGRHGDIIRVILPESIREIGEESFYMCFNLKEINFPQGITFIGDRAFAKCGCLSEVKLPESLQIIGEEVFKGCDKLTK